MVKPNLILLCALACLAAGCSGNGNPPSDENLPGVSRLPELLSGSDADGWPQAMAPRTFSFPRDHGPHPEYRNEWWYVTGNLDGAGGARYGFELTLFRFLLAPGKGDLSGQAETGRSAWRSAQVYIGHFAVTDVPAGRFHAAEERYARGALDLAGARAEPFEVWLEDWFIRELPADGDGANSRWQLSAADGDLRLSLILTALKPPVLNGDRGLSQKSAEPGNASYYYSMPRLAATGRISVGRRTDEVRGLAWLDREWGSSALADYQAGWDWFALQLSDGSDLMFYQLRRRDGGIDPHSAGTFIAADGSARSLAGDRVSVVVRRRWQSPRGGHYPAAWTLSVPELDLELEVEPVMADQELDTIVRYWEGAVDVVGSRGSEALSGRGYVELTGYAE